MDLLSFVIAAAAALVPNVDHDAVDRAIAQVVTDQPAIFTDDTDRRKTAALMIAVAFRESTFRLDAIGDQGRSHCAFQINLPGSSKTAEGWSGAELRTDAFRCVTVGLRMLRESVRIDPVFPVAFYARGPRWRTEEARRISRDRMAIAKRLSSLVVDEQ